VHFRFLGPHMGFFQYLLERAMKLLSRLSGSRFIVVRAQLHDDLAMSRGYAWSDACGS
jgi:hypothetical protein